MVALSGTRRDNCIYSLDGHAVTGRHTTQGVIDYIHLDLWGPFQAESLGGKMYFLSIVDDYSGRIWVYILMFKHETFGKSKEWKQLVGNWTGRTVKKLRTDKHQNGVAERMNRTLIDKENGDDEDARDQEIDQTLDLTDYQLVRDREPRTRMKPLRDRFSEEEQHLRVSRSSSWGKVDYELEQLDIKTTFLHENLEEVIYMRQSSGYEKGNKVCLLKKSLYSLKESPRQWYKRFDEYMLSNEFKRSSYNSYVYYMSYAPVRHEGSPRSKEDSWYRDRQGSVSQDSEGVTMRLKDFSVRDCDVERMSKVLYANAIGILMYLMVCTRPDIAYAELVDGDVEEVGDLSFKAIKNKEVALVDGVFDGAFGALGDQSRFLGDWVLESS
nr:reverse transcriptase [Tanacetum cinerariifolium]